MYLAFLLFSSVYAIYEDDTPVTLLTKADFDSEVLRGASPWIIEFYAPWCGHCKSLKDDWEELARGMGEIVKVGAVDATVQTEIASSYGIHGYPTILFFGQDKSAPKRYENAREADEIAKFSIDEMEAMVMKRLAVKHNPKKKRAGQKKATQGNDQCGDPNRGKEVDESYLEGIDESEVVVLNTKNYDELVTQTDDMYFIEFYAPWCSHCQQLAGVWAELGRWLKGEVKVAKCNAEENRSLGTKFNVPSFPTLIFVNGKDRDDWEKYEGGRQLATLYEAAIDKKKDFTVDFTVEHLSNVDELAEQCDKKKTLCIIAILDDEEDVALLKPTIKKFETRRIAFLWAKSGEQPGLEKEFRAKSPNILAMNFDKKNYFTMDSELTAKSIEDFVNGVQKNKYFFLTYKDMPKIEDIDN